MQMTDIAVDEIVRVGRWALRGLEMEFGMSERACHLLAWAEAVEGGAIASLAEYDILQKRQEIGEYRLYRNKPDWWDLRARNRSLLEVGPVAIDLLTYAARSLGAGRVDLIGINDPVYLTGLCRIAVQRKLSIVALSDTHLPMGGQPVPGIHARPGRDGLAIFGPVEGVPAEIAQSGGPWGADPLREGALTLIARVADGPFEPGPNDALLEDKLAHAQADGIPIPLELLNTFYGYEVRTWAPTSDRSRSQALV